MKTNLSALIKTHRAAASARRLFMQPVWAHDFLCNEQ
jgi:hypothetical protein